MYLNQCRISFKLCHDDWVESKNKNAKLTFLETAIVGVLKRCSQKFRKIRSKIPVSEFLFNKVAGLEILTKVLSCEFCEISKNPFFTEELYVTASVFPNLL